MLNILIHVFKKGRVLSHLSWQNFFFSPICSVCQGRDASSNTHILSQSLVELAKMEQFKNKLVSPSMTHKHAHIQGVCLHLSMFMNTLPRTLSHTYLKSIEWMLAWSSGFPLSLLHFPPRQRPLLGSSHHALELALQFGTLPVNT